jgi:hypothetical protein
MTLRTNDLKNLVYDIFEIDSYKSKMGQDSNIITLSFSVSEKAAAKDLVDFIEKGYDFVLDADSTTGEQSDSTYKVFVELERNRHAPEHIMEIVYGLNKLTGIERFKYRYYKNFKSREISQETLEANLPLDEQSYNIAVNENNLNNYKNFFNKSFVEDISLLDETLTIKKKYADPVQFRFLDFGDQENIMKNITESLNFNDFAEVIFLSKYIGDYNITKYGDKITMENNGKTLVVERIIL